MHQDMFLYGVFVPVVPFALRSRSHVPTDQVQYWVALLIAIYGGSLLVFSLAAGWLADHTSSRRSSLLLGLLALLGASVLLNIGANMTMLVIGRVLQGASAAVVFVIPFSFAFAAVRLLQFVMGVTENAIHLDSARR